ncbi:MAG: DUF6134 family protein [Woeseiaceae bacterium]|nr:DUF6134 family protein [Woeseiaceae bacterium]
MMRRYLAILGLLVAGTVAANIPSADDHTQTLEFDVYLDESLIGFHKFRINELGPVREVQSEANFDVKFLFITAFRYRHSLEERWVDGCLAELAARTNSNGKKTTIVGELTDDAFVIETSGERAALPPCVSTFAYWNPGFLEQPKLLNPQTGEYLEVSVEALPPRPISASGREQDARGFMITAKQFEVTVWYSEKDNRWLALESPAKGGRTIRYELS